MKNEKYTPPEFKKDIFNCPHCRVRVKQNWTNFWLRNGKREALCIFNPPTGPHDENYLTASHCTSCECYCLWLGIKIVYPESSNTPLPNADLPGKSMVNYKEAASILSRSPRAAAGLLRLAIEELCVELNCKGKDLNDKVKYLVENWGLGDEITEALKIVREIGNKAVHSSDVELVNDEKKMVLVFDVVNDIVDELITKPTKRRERNDALNIPKKTSP